MLVSVLVVGLTGYAWATLGGINNGLTTANVLDSQSGGTAPADGAVDVLLVGMDSRTDAQGHQLDPKVLAQLHAGSNQGEVNTDTMILVHIPNNGSKATGVSIPRDSVVDRPGYGKGKINSAYGAAKNTALRDLRAKGITDPATLDVQSNQAGAKELIKTVEELTGVTIDHFAQVNLVGFYDISQAIGGVPVCLKQDVSDPYYSGAHFHKGIQDVSGAQALAFVRQRHNIPGGSTDLERERRQQAFLASMAHKVLSAGILTNPSRLSSLMDAVKKAIVVDQGWDLVHFAQQMQSLTSGKLQFTTMPVVNIDADSPAYGKYVKVDPSQVQAYLKQQTDGPQKKSQQAKPSGQASNSASHSGITVEVRNAAGVTGMASQVLTALGDQGFTKGDTGNASSRSESIVRYPSGQKNHAAQVAKALGGNMTLEQDDSITTGHVRVFLGTGYTGPGSTGGETSAGSASTTSNAPAHPTQNPITDSGSGPACVN